MSDRPERILICGQPFKVEWSDILIDPEGSSVTPSGVCDVRQQELRILEGQAPHQERDTVVHEALHAIVDMTGHDKGFAKGAEEALVYSVATALLSVLRNNPSLVEWLTEELE